MPNSKKKKEAKNADLALIEMRKQGQIWHEYWLEERAFRNQGQSM